MTVSFRVEKHDHADKHFTIYGPIDLEVDYDDVNHAEQDRLAKRVAKILNEHWDEHPPSALR